jgi:hypothetical protein
MNLRDNATFQNVFLFCVFFGVGTYFILRYIFKKRGMDIYSRKSIVIFLSVGIIPVIVLLWLLPFLSLIAKLGITFVMVTTEFVYFYVLDKSGKRLRKQFGIKNEEDRWEEEKAKLGKK